MKRLPSGYAISRHDMSYIAKRVSTLKCRDGRRVRTLIWSTDAPSAVARGENRVPIAQRNALRPRTSEQWTVLQSRSNAVKYICRLRKLVKHVLTPSADVANLTFLGLAAKHSEISVVSSSISCVVMRLQPNQKSHKHIVLDAIAKALINHVTAMWKTLYCLFVVHDLEFLFMGGVKQMTLAKSKIHLSLFELSCHTIVHNHKTVGGSGHVQVQVKRENKR